MDDRFGVVVEVQLVPLGDVYAPAGPTATHCPPAHATHDNEDATESAVNHVWPS